MISTQHIASAFAKRNKWLIAGTLLVLTLSNFMNVLLPASIGLFYEVALHEHGPKGRIMHWLPLQITRPQQFLLFFAGIVLLKSVLTFFEKYWIGLTGERFSRDLRELTFARQLHHSLEAHQSRPVGKYLLRYSGDLLSVQQFINKGVLVFAGDVFFLLCAFWVLTAIDPGLSLIVLATFLISGLLVFFLSKRLRLRTEARRNQRARNLAFVSARLQAFYTIKSFNRETPESMAFVRLSRRLYTFGLQYFRLAALIQALFPFLFFGGLALVMLFVVRLNHRVPPGISSGDVLVFILITLYLRSVMRRLLQVNMVWQSGLVSFEKLLKLISLPSEPRGSGNLPEKVQGALAFEKVDFAYDPGKRVFRKLTFFVPPRSIAQVKGRGKSTLFRLLQKLYPPQNGSIRIDSSDYTNISSFELRKNIAVVSDDTPLLGDTVFKAISYKSSFRNRIRAADMIAALNIRLRREPEDTLDFKLEEQARNLSAGERTMVQIARALLTRKKILLLDDPFRNLDDERRKLLIRILNKQKKRRTILIASDELPEGILIDQTIDLQHEE